MKCKSLILIIFIGIYVFNPGFGQNWEWEWGNQITQKDAQTWSYLLDIDYQNNIYTGNQYGDSIFFGDTLFGHTGYYYDWSNWGIAKYDNQGKFQNAIDIATLPGKLIFGVELATDKDLNMYIACEFQQLIYLQDTIIYHGNIPVPDAPELFLAKLSPSFDVEWIRLISSPPQDQCQGLAISSDNFIYMATLHYGNGFSVETVNYFGQDSAVFEYTLCSLLKIDLEGNLVWRKELYSNEPGIMIRELNIDIYDNITLNGFVQDNLYYSNDTVFHPHPGEYKHRPFIIKTDPSGELSAGIIPDWSMALGDTDVDDLGNFYFAGFVWDTLYFGSDTLIQHEDSTVNILTKLNADYEPVWYETTRAKSEQGSYYFHIDSFQDTLFFAGRCRSNFTIFDTVFNLGSYYESFIGQVTPDGALDEFILTESLWGFKPFGIKLDNCNNIMVSGEFKGYTYLGQDTLESNTPGVWDGIITKINRVDPIPFDLGSDTLICDSIVLVGPEGYLYYYWNNNLSGQNWLTVSESGKYVFACTNDEGCWIRDTMNVIVQEGFTISLGEDTIITLPDTLTLSIPDVYDNYLWSTGSTENSIEITGNTFGQGNWDIWVEVTQGVCIANDTILLTVVDAVSELQDIGVMVYPNPAEDILYINSERKFEKIVLFDLKGTTIIIEENQNVLNSPLKIDLSHIPSGIYFIRIYFDNLIGTGKIIKL